MKRLLCIAALAALAPAGRADEVLSFDQVLARVESAHAVPATAVEAAKALEQPARMNVPTLRAETSASSAQNVDIFAQNVFRFDALEALLSLDYPLADGGTRAAEAQVAKLQAAAFRQRLRDAREQRFRETVDAVAQLYTAQERLRIMTAGLSRVVAMRDRAKDLAATQTISNVTAARWEDQSLAAQSQLLDLRLQRLAAETRVKQLMGDASPDSISITLPLDERQRGAGFNPPGRTEVRPTDDANQATLAYEQKRLTFVEAEAARRPQLTLSAFGGVAYLGDSYGISGRQRYGLYGIRFSVALPMFDSALARRVAEARLETEEANIERRTIVDRQRAQVAMMQLDVTAAEKRIALLTEAVDVAQRREESVVRLASAGIRSEADVADATVDRIKRESDLLAARVELWKDQQLLGAAQ